MNANSIKFFGGSRRSRDVRRLPRRYAIMSIPGTKGWTVIDRQNGGVNMAGGRVVSIEVARDVAARLNASAR